MCGAKGAGGLVLRNLFPAAVRGLGAALHLFD